MNINYGIFFIKKKIFLQSKYQNLWLKDNINIFKEFQNWRVFT